MSLQNNNREAFIHKLQSLTLEKSPPPDDATFADVIYIAQSAHGITEQSFRDAFGLTKGAVDRWTTQNNLPAPIMRQKILIWVKDQLLG